MLARLQKYGRLESVSLPSVAFLGLLLVSSLHLGALLVFIRGFLLTRVALPNVSPSLHQQHTQGQEITQARYSRAVVLIVDALRFDFMFHNADASSANPVHHNVLTLPTELTDSQPANSLMFRAMADPPTTTLQRLKALTVGTLPTFVDAGSNFAGSSIEEDNWVAQAQRHGKRVAFMGDDTWTSLFPAGQTGMGGQGTGALAEDLTFPFDSFNVEDLETVDRGVKKHLMPLLKNSTADWDIAIGHMLGLDHVGHRLGSYHPEMTRKLREADGLLRDIVDLLREDDLLVLMGDHGMDVNGNHGGDTAEEIQASLWLYTKSKSKPLTAAPQTDLSEANPLHSLFDTSKDLFDFGGKSFRSVTQISFVPTFSLLLGLPIPFSNLAPVIPEVFMTSKPAASWFGAADSAELTQAAALNARQVFDFLQTYVPVSGSNEFASVMPRLTALYNEATSQNNAKAYFDFMDQVLQASRDVWATFNAPFMVCGLFMLYASLAVLLKVARLASLDGALQRGGPLRLLIGRAVVASLLSLALGSPILYLWLRQPLLLSLLAPVSLTVSTSLLVPAPQAVLPKTTTSDPTRFSWSGAVLALVPILHAASFASNSFTFWEERTSLYFVQLPLLLLFIQGFSSADKRLRKRIASFSALAMVCLRLINLSTVCREEQQPYCLATYNLGSSFSLQHPYSPAMVVGSLLAAFVLPTIFSIFLGISSSEQNTAPQYLSLGLRGCLTAGSAYWATEWLLGATDILQQIFGVNTSFLQNSLGLSVFANAALGLFIWRFFSGLNLSLEEVTDEASGRTSIKLIGYANVLGSTYLLFYSVCLALVWAATQSSGHIVLLGFCIALLAYLEAADSRKDDIQFKRRIEEMGTQQEQGVVTIAPHPAPSFGEVSVLCLMGVTLFFSTGHEAVLSTIQWKAAFVGVSSVVYPFSPILVLVNTCGPTMLSALAVPLLVFWNVGPPLRGAPARPLLRQLFRTCILFSCYFTMLAISAATFAAWHRRHLMVWKVFAPRFMLSSILLLAVDAALLLALWAGSIVLRKSSRMLGSSWT